LDETDLFMRELTVTASYSAGPRDMRAALAMLTEGLLDPASLITHRLPLDQTAWALELQRSGSALKVVVVP
jgi:L-iditol 2-dehydrogenase